MEWVWTQSFWTTLGAIVVINLVLSGDNAVVIALAARNLSRAYQRRAIVWGTAGAVLLRIALTLAAVWLLSVPCLRAAGGVALAWIGYRLLTDGETEPEKPRAARSTFQGAIRTIIVADATMGLDNVLGVAGAAHGSVPMVALGLVLSIPIVVWGSTLLLGLLRRFPGLLYIGGAVLAWTAVEMFVEEPLLAPILGPHEEWTLAAQILVTSAMLGTAWLRNRRPVSPYGVQISPAMHSAQSPAKAEI